MASPPRDKEQKRIEAERGLYKRVVIASHDLADARACLNRLLGLNGERRASLTAALVLAYGRCCAPSRSTAGVPAAVPGSYRMSLDVSQRGLHDRLLALRDEQYAHSDADAASVRVSVLAPDIAPALMPVSNRLRMPFSDRQLAEIGGLLSSLHVYLYDQMVRLNTFLGQHGDF
jgi:hypothetical protein